jgi:hypothetical protein
MPDGGWLLITWILLLAAWIVVHVAAVTLVLQERELDRKYKVWVLVPLLTPLVAWRVRRRAVSVLWCTSLALYVVLRSLA